MKNIILIVVLFVCNILFSQSKTFDISGIIVMDKDSSVLESATVYLQTARDSTLITYTISDKEGKFVIENKTSDNFVNLYISYIGYKTFHKKIKLDRSSIDLGKLRVVENSNTLDEVIIKAVAPITIKLDTIEYNVKSFKTKKDANVEDLLKELPGFEIDENGVITINGKVMDKILVNGKPFFGGDPTIATKNFSKDMIQKIQVLDTKTDSQAFTGEEGDATNKTINLVIRKEDNRGVFGRVAAGFGTDERYEAAGMLSLFNDGQQFSVLAGGNNINSPGFSYGEINKMFGGNASSNIDSQVFGYGNQGIVTSENAGLNFSDDVGKKITISTNYFYSNSDSENENISNTENTLPENRYYSNSNSSSISNGEKHSTETKFQIKLDSTILITIEPEFRFDKGTNINNTNEKSLDEDMVLVNESTSSSIEENNNNSFANGMNFTKRFGNKGGFFKLDIYNSVEKSNSENLFNSEVEFNDDSTENIIQNVNIVEKGSGNTFESSLVYRMPIKAELSLDIKYSHRTRKEKNFIEVFDIEETSNTLTSNDSLNSDFEYLNTTNTPGLSLRYRKDKWSSSLGGEMVLRTLENKDYLRPSSNLERNFNALDVRYRLRFRSPINSYSFRYDLSNNPAQLSQLQTVVNITDPLNIVIGNPNLKQTKSHRLSAYYNYNNFQKGKSFYASIRSNIYNDRVISKSEIDEEDLIKRTTYTNVDGSYNFYSYLDYGKKIKLDSVKTLRLSVGLRGSINRSINYFNDVQFASLSESVSPNLRASFRWIDVTDIDLRYSFSLNNNTYSSDVYENQKFNSHQVYLRTTNFFYKKIELRNQLRYSYNTNISDGFDKNSIFWNATIAYSFMKDMATLTLKGYDLLNQNTDARRIINGNTISDTQNTVLKRYFMLSFSWKFNTLGKAGEVDNRRGRRMR
ncbi:outer membrane beta-barrel protein [Flavicella sp.]|uniref:outer membrane beta-barrel protein n=1 Tax=Flavicella sp. TaxID=2957742 RepID=UPI00301862B5